MDNGEDVGDHCGHVEMQLISDKSNSEVYSSGDDNENAIDPEHGGCEDTYSAEDYCETKDFGNDEDGYFYDEEYDFSEY